MAPSVIQSNKEESGVKHTNIPYCFQNTKPDFRNADRNKEESFLQSNEIRQCHPHYSGNPMEL